MKPYHLITPFMLAALAVLGGASSVRAAATDTACLPSSAVFYTSDTQNLAKTLGATRSACVDYYISISPMTAAPNVGEPRDGAALAAVHAQGAHFHALAELQPKQWATRVAALGGWYAIGVKLHDDMLAAGYDSALGDTWAVNEVGWPSDSTVNTDVYDNVGDARQSFRDFVRGLYTGSSGPPMKGLVFAASPIQVWPDPSQYAHGLQSWYADTPFWEDMHAYVNFWGQEAYADARAWGVAGATLDERVAYLNDYYLHGSRIADEGNDATAAARAFFADAYTPIGNASFKWGAPDLTTGIGYGYTDIGRAGMLAFISAQTYALRSSSADRFGFAVTPKNGGTDTPFVEGRVAAAIHDSETGPPGACTATGEWCDFDVAGAAFTDTWRAFANTLEGTNVSVHVGSGVSVTYDAVAARGATWFSSTPSASAPAGFQPVGRTYRLATTAFSAGPVTVCLPYDAAVAGTRMPHLFETSDTGWVDVTTSGGCGTATTLGTFALFLDPTPPVITANVVGAKGNDGWYTGDVTVSWTVTDPETAITSPPCDTVTLVTDTTGTALACTATSDGGTSHVSIIVKRDATPPTIACAPTPADLWPPSGKLVPVDVAVTVADATSGPAGFTLTQAPADGAAGFVVGTPDVSGLLRADRPGTARDGHVYELTYTAHDAAGNSAECTATVTVPHDQG